ncbi:hypothetical protein [Rhizobium leguminosarum]|uniref:hypothetical protein n=1 Tax=Rhizobium leguminosarum TaxID=384 RepID=UPI0021BBC8E8|nr:hypothetical protein [Rhizobium leguminosarum]
MTLQPGYRFDALVLFPAAGDYCVVNEPVPGTASVTRADQDRQLLATVSVAAGTPVSNIDTALMDTLVAAAAASAKTLALNDKLTSVIAATAANAAIAGLTTTSTENSKTATENAPLSLPFKIPAGALQNIFSQPPLPSGMDTMDFGAAQEQAASAPRVLAFLRDVEITSASTTSRPRT